MRRLSPITTRLVRLRERLKAYQVPASALKEVDDALFHAMNAHAELGQVPASWKPARGSVGAGPLQPGDKVTLKPYVVERYGGLVKPGDVFEIERIAGMHVIVRSEPDAEGSPVRMPLSRSAVTRVRS
jgi:hypothetical protein